MIDWINLLKLCLEQISPNCLCWPKLKTLISWWIFCLFDHWMTWNKWVMLNWSLIGLNFDLEQFSQIKVGLAEFNWIWNSLCFLYFDSLDEFNWFGKWWLWIQFDWNLIGLKTPNCQDFKACEMGLVLINCVRHYLMLKCMIKYANWCFRNIN